MIASGACTLGEVRGTLLSVQVSHSFIGVIMPVSLLVQHSFAPRQLYKVWLSGTKSGLKIVQNVMGLNVFFSQISLMGPDLIPKSKFANTLIINSNQS